MAAAMASATAAATKASAGADTSADTTEDQGQSNARPFSFNNFMRRELAQPDPPVGAARRKRKAPEAPGEAAPDGSASPEAADASELEAQRRQAAFERRVAAGDIRMPTSSPRQPSLAAMRAALAFGHEASGARRPPPWQRMSGRGSCACGARCGRVACVLTADIAALHAELAPTDADLAARNAVAHKYAAAATARLSGLGVQAHVFGSVATRTCLPSSDMDLVLVAPSSEPPTQGRMSSRLSKLLPVLRPLTQRMLFIGRARVPVIKLVDRETGLAVDVSFSSTDATPAIVAVNRLSAELPALRPLVFVLKQFLHVRGLNEVATGGIGGYALVLWIAAFLRLHPLVCRRGAPRDGTHTIKRMRGESRDGAVESIDARLPVDGEPSLGQLLLDFLQLFGTEFDYDTFGLDPTGSDLATLLVDRSRLPQEARPPRSRRLTIIDPTNRANDVSKGSHAIDKIADELAAAHDVLVAPHADLQRIAAGSVPRQPSALLARMLHIQPDAEALRRRLRYTAQPPQPAAMNRGQCTA